MCLIRVYPNGTQKISPIRVGFEVLARAISPADPNGTIILFFTFSEQLNTESINQSGIIDLKASGIIQGPSIFVKRK